MERKEIIKTTIEKYGISDPRNGKLLITKNLEEAATVVPPMKTEILAYFAEEREAKKAEEERKQNVFMAIPGVRAVSDARTAWGKYKTEFDRAMNSGGSVFPTKPKVDLAALEESSPLAVWALSIERQARYGTNFELSRIAQKAYDALRAGVNPEAAKAEYDAAKSEYAQKHMMD